MCISKFSVSDPDPRKEMSPGSGSAWIDADLDPGGKKSIENVQVHDFLCNFERFS